MLEGSAIEIAIDTKTSIWPEAENAFRKEENSSNIYKEKYYTLLKTVEQQRMELKTQKTHILGLEEKLSSLQTLNNESNQKFQELLDEHVLCREEKETLKSDADKIKTDYEILKYSFEEEQKLHCKEMSDANKKHASVLVSQQKLHDGDLLLQKESFDEDTKQMRCIHNDILKSKDEQLEKLKLQLADRFQDKSNIRQGQIDELVKELKRVSDEAEYVKSALKKLKFGNECQRCSFYENKCKLISNELIVKQQTCESLFEVCSKMERQLNQQEDLRILWRKIKDSET